MRANSAIPSQPTSTVVTDRDVSMLGAAHDHGVITRRQLQLLFSWNCVSDINRRLRKLCDSRYLERRYLSRKPVMASAIYLLGPEGAALLARIAGAEKGAYERRRHRYLNLGSSLLPHELDITQFACCLRQALSRQVDAQLLEWVHTDEVGNRCRIDGIMPDLSLNPDASGSYRLGRLQFNFFLELDRGTEPHERLQKKIEYYRVLKASSLFEKRSPKRSFRLLFVANSMQRAMNMTRFLSPVPELKVFVATLGDLDTDLLSKGVWRRPGETALFSLHSSAELTERRASDAVLP